MNMTASQISESLNVLLAHGESRRLARVPSRPMSKVGWDGVAWSGECSGEERATQRPRITLAGRRSFNCTCTDKQRVGRTLGPCKHVLSLATAALEATASTLEGAA